MQGGARFLRLFAALLAVAALTPAFGSLDASAPWLSKLDPMLQQRVLADRKGSSPVIIRFADGKSLKTAVQVIEESEGAARRRLPIIEGQVAVIPNRTLLRSWPHARPSNASRSIGRSWAPTSAPARPSAPPPYARARLRRIRRRRRRHRFRRHAVARRSVTGRTARSASIASSISSTASTTPYDDYGHGTHVAGIIAGNGFDSGGARSGIAPGAHLIVLKVLDGAGSGTHQRRHRGARLRRRATRTR